MSDRADGPLHDLRVVDLATVVAGPGCARYLADFGADVIKVERPGSGDTTRAMGWTHPDDDVTLWWKLAGRNKRTVVADLKDPDDLDRVRRLIATADVLVENFRPKVMERLGFGYEAVRAINPRMVYCAISGFGQEGPLSGNPAYDQIVQGLSGVMSVTGDAQSAPLRVGYPLCDTLGALAAAFAVVSALYRRHQSGRGEYIDLSMLDATISAMGWAVSNYLIAGVEAQPIGNQNMTAAPSGAFRCADAQINIAANKQEQFERLCRTIGRPEIATDPRFVEREARKVNRAALNALIEEGLQSRTAAEWEVALNAEGIPAGQILTVPQILAHPQIAARNLVQELPMEGSSLASIKVVRAGYTLADSQPGARSAPPLLGADNAAIFSALGLRPEDLERLGDIGAI